MTDNIHYSDSTNSRSSGVSYSQRNSNSEAKKAITEIVIILIIAVIAAVLVRAFLLQLFYIPSPSMEPTLKVNDKIFVNKLSYKFHEIDRGDIIVFDAPASVKSDKIKDLIKRVVALPGETIEGKCESGNGPCNVDIYIDGKKLNEPYIGDDIFYSPFSAVTVPANSVFVMGDNRGNSEDARVFGPIPKDTIVGRAFLRIMPLSGFGFL